MNTVYCAVCFTEKVFKVHTHTQREMERARAQNLKRI